MTSNNLDFVARCMIGHNKTAIKSITTELENVQKQVGTNKNNISSVQAQADWNSATGVTNLFDFDTWKQGLTAMRGTVSISENSVTVQATSNDAYTKTGTLSISVMPNTKYILTWNTTATTEHNGTAYIFPNVSTFKYTISTNERLEFTTGSGDTSITIRFGVNTSGDSITYSNIMLRSGTITDNTYQPYALSNAELTTNKQDKLLTGYSATVTPTSQQTIVATDSVVEGFEKLDNNVRLNEYNISTANAELIELVDSGAKNFFKPTITSGVDSDTNLTLTVNSDNTITVSGTAQSSKYIVIGRGYTTAGNYVLSGTPSGITVDTGGYMRIEQGGDGVSQVLTPVDITLDNREYVVYLRVLSGKTYNHTISPMLCTKAAWDVSQKYVPYAPTNAELYEMIKALQS